MEQVSAKISVQPTRLVCLPGGNQRLAPAARKSAKSQAIQPFQPEEPDRSSAIAPQDRFQIDLHRLETQARRVNELSAELEKALWELKAIASQVNQSSCIFREQFGHDWFPAQICEYHSVELPTLRQQESTQLVLAARTVDLMSAEREAEELAAKLRQRRTRKRKSTATQKTATTKKTTAKQKTAAKQKTTAETATVPAAATSAAPEPEAKPKRRRKSTAAKKTAAASGDRASQTQTKTTRTRKPKATGTRKTTTRRKAAEQVATANES